MTPPSPGQEPSGEPERQIGRLHNWQASRGFGFLRPEDQGEDAFAHIRSFAKDDRLIEDGHLYSYLTVRDAAGRLRAADIRPVRTPRLPAARPEMPRAHDPAPERVVRLMILPAFLFIVAAIAHSVTLSWLWLVIYGVASGVTFVGYRVDKQAAADRRWRISETILLMLGLAGGWPGAIVAQEMYRHKTRKVTFRILFWISVAINIAGFVQIAAFSGVSP